MIARPMGKSGARSCYLYPNLYPYRPLCFLYSYCFKAGGFIYYPWYE